MEGKTWCCTFMIHGVVVCKPFFHCDATDANVDVSVVIVFARAVLTHTSHKQYAERNSAANKGFSFFACHYCSSDVMATAATTAA